MLAFLSLFPKYPGFLQDRFIKLVLFWKNMGKKECGSCLLNAPRIVAFKWNLSNQRLIKYLFSLHQFFRSELVNQDSIYCSQCTSPVWGDELQTLLYRVCTVSPVEMILVKKKKNNPQTNVVHLPLVYRSFFNFINWLFGSWYLQPDDWRSAHGW